MEARIDAANEERLYLEWQDFVAGKNTRPLFDPKRGQKTPPRIAWSFMSFNAAQQSTDNMIYQQLSECSLQLTNGSGALLNVRANYGTGIMPTLFGAELFFLDDAQNTLPTTKPLAGGKDAIRKLIDAGRPAITSGRGADVLAFYNRFRDSTANYPKVARFVHAYHQDLQGPMDICELLWGSSIFVDLYDQPGLVHALLRLATETYTAFLKETEKVLPSYNGTTVHWGGLIKGKIMLRDDSAMNLSPAMFREFIAPYDQQLLDEFDGGAIHFCGKGDHYIDQIGAMRKAWCVQMSQPEYNNMETIWQHTVDKGLRLNGMPRAAGEAAVKAGRDLKRFMHVH
jgi:hypothetical protein